MTATDQSAGQSLRDLVGTALAGIALVVEAFRPQPKLHRKSAFIGYADVRFVVPGALPGGHDLNLFVKDFEVKLMASGARVDFKSIPGKPAANGSPSYFDTGWPGSKETREWLTREVFHGDPAIMEIAKPLWAQLQAQLAGGVDLG